MPYSNGRWLTGDPMVESITVSTLYLRPMAAKRS